MAINDLYQLVLTAKYNFTEPTLVNAFYYRDIVGLTSDAAESLANEFQLDVLPKIAAVVTGSTKFTKLVVKNLYDPTDFWEELLSVAGDRSGEAMPPFNAWSFVSNRKRADIRPGQKRFGILSETDVSTGGFVESGLVTAMDDLASALGFRMQVSLFDTWEPRVVKRIRSGVPGEYTYRLPESQGEEVSFYPDTWQYRTAVTTQNTRKHGRGI